MAEAGGKGLPESCMEPACFIGAHNLGLKWQQKGAEMLDHTKANFRACRELVGLSQQDLAYEMDVLLKSVKRWENPNPSMEYYYEAPEDAWAIIGRYLDEQNDAVDAAVDAASKLDDKQRETEVIPVVYYRTQRDYNAYHADRKPVNVANATSRAIAQELVKQGYNIEFRYPEDMDM